jgi:hypothetical protein
MEDRMRALTSGILGFLALASCAPADEVREPQTPSAAFLMASERAYEEAQLTGDAEELQRLIADDYVLVGSDGARQNKAELIAFWTADGFDPQATPVTDKVEFVWNESAVFGGTTTLSWTQDGAPVSVTIRYVDVWAFRDGRWQVVYGQSTRAP